MPSRLPPANGTIASGQPPGAAAALVGGAALGAEEDAALGAEPLVTGPAPGPDASELGAALALADPADVAPALAAPADVALALVVDSRSPPMLRASRTPPAASPP
ncbi:MAG: hypothetical protein HY908_19840, partial [Myxococcales bacterium]|nr:hypothetical protein [Myxococcales bacterium]